MTDHAAPSAPLPAPSDDTAERLARLRLIRSPKVGPVTYRRLIAEYGSGAYALAALPQIAAKAGVADYAAYSKSAAQAEIRAAQSCAARALFLGEAAYPATLAALSDAPPFLWAIGDLDLLTRPMVGMVGTRNASALGLRMARAVARDLDQAGIVTASGLARDITHHDTPHAMILSFIGAGAVSKDHLARVSAMPSADLARHLTELELAGEITRSAGGMVARSDHSAADSAAQRHQTAA